MVDMDVHQTIVSAALVTKSDAQTPTKARDIRPDAISWPMLEQVRQSKLLASEVGRVMMLCPCPTAHSGATR